MPRPPNHPSSFRGARISAFTRVFDALCRGAHAQTFSSQPITIIVPYPGGGPVDITARLIARSIPEYTLVPLGVPAMLLVLVLILRHAVTEVGASAWWHSAAQPIK